MSRSAYAPPSPHRHELVRVDVQFVAVRGGDIEPPAVGHCGPGGSAAARRSGGGDGAGPRRRRGAPSAGVAVAVTGGEAVGRG